MPYIGLFIHPWHTYGQDLLRGISRYVSKKSDWECYLPWPGAPGVWAKLPSEPLDGLIMRAGSEYDVPAEFGVNSKRVVIANTDQLAMPVDITWNNHRVGELAGEHLLEQGHRVILFIGRLTNLPYHRERGQGIQKMLAARHIECRMIDRDQIDSNMLRKLIEALPKPAAIFTATDPMGAEVLHTARALRRQVPEELAVISAGDNEIFCELSSPPLSSVALPGAEAGYLAAARLDRLLLGKPVREPIIVTPRYVTVRRSSDMLAIDDQLIVRVVQLIRQRALEGLTVQEIHDAVPLSRRALELRFKKVLGRTIEQEVRRFRIEHAKHLLSETDLPMDDVADRAGFSSAQRLSAVFAREEKVPPSAYRRRAREMNFRE